MERFQDEVVKGKAASRGPESWEVNLGKSVLGDTPYLFFLSACSVDPEYQ